MLLVAVGGARRDLRLVEYRERREEVARTAEQVLGLQTRHGALRAQFYVPGLLGARRVLRRVQMLSSMIIAALVGSLLTHFIRQVGPEAYSRRVSKGRTTGEGVILLHCTFYENLNTPLIIDFSAEHDARDIVKRSSAEFYHQIF